MMYYTILFLLWCYGVTCTLIVVSYCWCWWRRWCYDVDDYDDDDGHVDEDDVDDVVHGDVGDDYEVDDHGDDDDVYYDYGVVGDDVDDSGDDDDCGDETTLVVVVRSWSRTTAPEIRTLF